MSCACLRGYDRQVKLRRRVKFDERLRLRISVSHGRCCAHAVATIISGKVPNMPASAVDSRRESLNVLKMRGTVTPGQGHSWHGSSKLVGPK
jgi:hypothetical protein